MARNTRTAGPCGEAALRAKLRVPPGGGPVRLRSYDPRATPGGPAGKTEALACVPYVRERITALQVRLFAQSTAGDPRSVLVVLQGLDTSGKGGAVRHLASLMDPAGCRITAFKAPTVEEKAHHFLWRVERALPGPGRIGVFDRSHYEDVLVPRVRGGAPPELWEERCETINSFEASLADDGVSVVKVFLHISRDEQRARLLARLDDPCKRWKFAPADLEDRARWAFYQEAYGDLLGRCSTEAAPWYVVPADRKWYRNWALGRLLLEHLELIDPVCPPAAFDVGAARRRLLAD
ncbi:PPK2 family polyphosphate kinase [Actinacidiphila sp. bgisy167]|uniref:PPK2 family polyphosphate kinase n=1 Tax=Actinacidiphila sp. bgisy167 TaxID=3413797 RepID=UPI003D71C0C9